jgi:hypothetical protein
MTIRPTANIRSSLVLVVQSVIPAPDACLTVA